ncbi:class I SAM-dependent methyltransferase [Candidatus Binatus sp.]|uniref:class I SAM-dependent methyltransferase n=1 Tax=Candidatus Binatus sp. TaxID=2811406 RepID=UPI003C387FAD
MTDIYRRPDEYDLEHVGDEEDVVFYVGLAKSLHPRSVLELACGTGRITVPLAEEGARSGFSVVGLDSEVNMLRQARDKARQMPEAARKRLKLVHGDMRKWHGREPFDLIVVPCASITHFLDLDEELEVWRRAFQNLAPGGRFVVETVMPNFSAYADSFSNPPRTLVEIDRDVTDEPRKIRLVRRKTVNYLPDEQRAQIRFLYEKYHRKSLVECYIDDFESHVYFPRELRLLFLHTGFEIENVFGDYNRRPLRASSQLMIMIGKKPTGKLFEENGRNSSN